VWEGVAQVRDLVAAQAPAPLLHDGGHVLACSSAGGGLRLAVVGFERDVTARAGRMVALSAGASVVFLSSGRLGEQEVQGLRLAAADLVLLVGGTDGGNADTLLHNATRLAQAGLNLPVVAAGNRDATAQVQAILVAAGVTTATAGNVLPRIGHVSPEPARAAIRGAFLSHVIGGKQLSRHPAFASAVRAATPDTIRAAVGVLRQVTGEDVMVIDVGGATTDVYSAVEPHGGEAAPRHDVVGSLRVARTVEGDLGMRYSAGGVIAAAGHEALPVGPELEQWAQTVVTRPGTASQSSRERHADLQLSGLCALIAARRHARPHQPTAEPRALGEVRTVVVSGGVFRREGPHRARGAVGPVLSDVGGGWQPPDRARVILDSSYVLAAIGLLAEDRPQAAASLAAEVVGGQGR